MPANSAKNLIFCSRKCTAKPIPCFLKHPAWRAKRWRLPAFLSKSKPKSKNCGNRCRTSNERAKNGFAAGVDRVGALGLRKIDLGSEDSGAARNHVLGVIYH